jgi:hypothetical protein
MSDEEEVGYGKPPKKHQFKPGTSGNRKGRPRKPRRLMVPRQMHRDILKVAEMEMEVTTPAGMEKMTLGELVFFRVGKDAANGKPTAMRLWISLLADALQQRLEDHPSVQLADAMRYLCEDPTREPEPGLEGALDNMINRSKHL